MFDEHEHLLYVGKAKNIKNRLSSYFRQNGQTPKTAALVSKIASIEVTITVNETEALLLEQSLIKSLHPPYNILLRDDKSYPYVYLSKSTYPRLSLYRGSKKLKGQYFGPYPSSGSIRETLHILQKTFGVRQCEDSYFKNRTRPCLQYQIKRCKAPCVNLISPEDYAQDVYYSTLFLEGKSNLLSSELAQLMEQASGSLDFEKAALLRDQIIALRRTQDQQSIEGGQGNIDIASISSHSCKACIHLLTVREGKVLGSKNFFPKIIIEEEVETILTTFLAQYYLATTIDRALPEELITNIPLNDVQLLVTAINQTKKSKLIISQRVRGIRAQWQQLAQVNAEQALSNHLATKQTMTERLVLLSQALNSKSDIKRLECFDISHSSGEATVASCVVFNETGALKSDYRRYNIEGVTAGDDYAAMQQALLRRFKNIRNNPDKIPDILLVDGGKGQLNMAKDLLEQLNISFITLIGVAKGITRKPGLETLYLNDASNEFVLPSSSPALHLIQQIRDEAHRFAITGHRARRDKARKVSRFEELSGVGPKRRKALLIHFGGKQELIRASQEDISKVTGISKKLAESIYNELHSS
ncbi:UNVERIFIED_CONTAM: hypothetical protein GTU68_052696 [Idotea baltica]|nr:hypothetical protein [Idotea baltica]